MLEVGRIGRPHGLKGDVMVLLVTDRIERVAVGTTLQSDRGDLRIDRSSPHQNGHIVHFNGVDTREAAEALRGTLLSAPAIHDPDAYWVHDLVGATVVDVAGTAHGSVVAVEANPASDLLVLEGGALVPLRFVIERTPGRLVIDPPAGLLGDSP